jgi:tRNA dimethylallyltransferase
MLYITALIDGFQPLASDPEIRERLNREYDQDSGESLMQQLKELDPSSAVGIPVQNKVYLVRALEIALSTGKSKSSQQVKSGSSYDLLLFGMSVDTETLKVRIEKRINTMLESGWVHEVKRLRELGYSASDPAMESHGYREIMASLAEGKIDTKSLTEGIARKSIRYTKRSMTWWKRDPRVQWVKI